MCPFLHLLESFETKPGGRGGGVLAPLALHRVVAARCLLSVTGAVPVPVELPKFLLFFLFFFSSSYKCLASPACWRLGLRRGQSSGWMGHVALGHSLLGQPCRIQVCRTQPQGMRWCLESASGWSCLPTGRAPWGPKL